MGISFIKILCIYAFLRNFWQMKLEVHAKKKK